MRGQKKGEAEQNCNELYGRPVDMGAAAVMHATAEAQLAVESEKERKYRWKVNGAREIGRVPSPWVEYYLRDSPMYPQTVFRQRFRTPRTHFYGARGFARLKFGYMEYKSGRSGT